LYASSILTILTTVVKSKDINLIEESLPCLEAFCANHDGSNLSSDEQYVTQFEEAMQLYANCANAPSGSQEIRWRSVGLKAIKSISSSEALSAVDAKQQLAIIIPVVLNNVYSEDDDHLVELQHRISSLEHVEETNPLRPRMSIGTIDGAMANTAADADMLELQDIELLALQSLRRIFEVNNPPQIRFATAAVIGYVSRRESVAEVWMTSLIEMLARWTQVQYRFLILLEIMETLVAAPMKEADLSRQLVLAQLISWLLGSTVNLVGLSIMDVLLSIIAKIMQLLQLEQKTDNGVKPVGHTNTITAIFQMTSTITEVAQAPSSTRRQLLDRMRRCIADLATHIYYSDQISDIVTELLARLKPSPSTPLTTDPAVAGAAVGNLIEQPNVDDFFSFDTARAVALQSIRDLLVVANQKNQGGIGRNTVPLSVWDGTHWLLNDEERGVRMSYIEAFCTYLKIELDRPDSPSSVAATVVEANSLKITARASKLLNSTFMKMLHVSIYESAMTHAGSSQDMAAIFKLLTYTVQKLGLPALTSGVPMIFKLQEDAAKLTDQKASMSLQTLVAAYLYIVADSVSLEDMRHDILVGIDRRKQQGQWFRAIVCPPVSGEPIEQYLDEKMPYVSDKPIQLFDNRDLLVQELCGAYAPEEAEQSFPVKVREQLLQPWSKEIVLSSIEGHNSHSASLHESRHQHQGTVRSYLSVNGQHGHRGRSRLDSPSRPGTGVYTVPGNNERFQRDRASRQSVGSKSQTNVSVSRSSSSRESTVRAKELKQVLSSGGGTTKHRNTIIGSRQEHHGVMMHGDSAMRSDVDSESSGSALDNDNMSYSSSEFSQTAEQQQQRARSKSTNSDRRPSPLPPPIEDDYTPPLPSVSAAVMAKLNGASTATTRSQNLMAHSQNIAVSSVNDNVPATTTTSTSAVAQSSASPIVTNSFKDFTFFDTDETHNTGATTTTTSPPPPPAHISYADPDVVTGKNNNTTTSQNIQQSLISSTPATMHNNNNHSNNDDEFTEQHGRHAQQQPSQQQFNIRSSGPPSPVEGLGVARRMSVSRQSATGTSSTGNNPATMTAAPVVDVKSLLSGIGVEGGRSKMGSLRGKKGGGGVGAVGGAFGSDLSRGGEGGGFKPPY